MKEAKFVSRMTYFVFLTIIVRNVFNFRRSWSTKSFAQENDTHREAGKTIQTPTDPCSSQPLPSLPISFFFEILSPVILAFFNRKLTMLIQQVEENGVKQEKNN